MSQSAKRKGDHPVRQSAEMIMCGNRITIQAGKPAEFVLLVLFRELMHLRSSVRFLIRTKLLL